MAAGGASNGSTGEKAVAEIVAELRGTIAQLTALRAALVEVGGFCCPRCTAISFHPKDVEHGYCGRCHDWTGEPRHG